MMPEDLSLLDQLEEWLEQQVPQNLNDLPYRMLATMERISNEVFETLNIHGTPSISIPFPPFQGKEPVIPSPPPTPPSFPVTIYNKAERLVKAHPYVVGTGAALAMTVGLGYGGALLGYGGRWGKKVRERKKFGTRGVVDDGMLKEAIVILAPSPMPPLLWTLTVTLLKAGYVVLVAVPHVEDAEALEKRLAPLDEKSALRVLIYDPEDSTTFPPFHRSLLATLTLRFVAHNAENSNDPHPNHLPHIHAFISLYPLNPAPPTQPGALPALPTLLSPDATGRVPRLITLYPSGSVLVQPDSFASQVLTANHRLLGSNLAASSSARIVSVFIGHLNLPPLHQMISNVRLMIYRFTLKDKWNQASWWGKVFVAKDAFITGLGHVWSSITGNAGIGAAAKDYRFFEKKILKILKSRRRDNYAVGQYPLLPFALSRIHPVILPRVLPLLLPILPTLPGATGPLYASVQGLPAQRKPLVSGKSGPSASSRSAGKSQPTSASSSDHESGEDLGSSIHSLHSVHSAQTTSSREAESTGSGAGLEESWAHLDSGN